MAQEDKIVGRCTACSGSVVKEVTSKYNPMSGPPIFGPGSQNQYIEETSYHCEDCGIEYRFPPTDAEKINRSRESSKKIGKISITSRDDLPPKMSIKERE